MNKPFAAIAGAATIAVAVLAGCHDHDQPAPASGSDSTMKPGMDSSTTSMGKPMVGNPGATTGPAVGYPRSDTGDYHPQTDDTHQYHPAPASADQPTTMPTH